MANTTMNNSLTMGELTDNAKILNYLITQKKSVSKFNVNRNTYVKSGDCFFFFNRIRALLNKNPNNSTLINIKNRLYKLGKLLEKSEKNDEPMFFEC